MQQDAYICFQVLYASKYLYIWLHIAIYTHICTILVPRGMRDQFIVHSQASKLVCTTQVRCNTTQLPCGGL